MPDCPHSAETVGMAEHTHDQEAFERWASHREPRRPLSKAIIIPLWGFSLLFVLFVGLAAIAPDIRDDTASAEFSEWDGSHPASVKTIKSIMHDPSTMEIVDTRFNDEIVLTTVRGTNAFGGTVTNTYITDRETGAYRGRWD